MKCLVFGNGWLGNQLAEQFGGVISSADILDTEEVAKEVLRVRPDLIINAAGKCGKKNIDWCEEPKEHADLTRYVNSYGPVTLYHMAHAVMSSIGKEFKFVHLSSGCLWEWGEDLTEDTTPDPPSTYSMTKAMGEVRLPECDNILIVRLRMPLSGTPHPRNLLNKLAGYDKVIDVQNSVTVIEDLLPAVEKLVKDGRHGVYNIVNPGSISGAELMKMYLEIVDPNHCFEVISMEELGPLVKAGRSNVTLNTDKLNEAGIELPPIRERARELLHSYAEKLR